MGQRHILHCDCNCFYASVEMQEHPELRGKSIAVCGDPEARHGIVLTASYPAKRMGVKTGMPIWEAKQHCRDLIIVPASYGKYQKYSSYVREVFNDYTNQVESFGLDEAWLDITGSVGLFGSPVKIAKEISVRIKRELGITVSIGVSFNKITAKLGSDYKKPDGITIIEPENYKEIVYPLPAGDLLYVGAATQRKLGSHGIRTIGQLAETNPETLKGWFGVMGYTLSAFARGLDQTPVAKQDAHSAIKSVGNSATTPRDLTTDEDVWLMLVLLSESVAMRMRDLGSKCNGYIGTRGTHEEAYDFDEQHGLEGNFLNGLYEQEHVRYGEWNFGFPTESQTILNVPNCKTIRLVVDGEPMDIRTGTLQNYRRTLDMKHGQVVRSFEWTSPNGKTVRVENTRFVSLAHKNRMAQRYSVTPVNFSGTLTLHSALDADVENHTRTTNPLVDYGPFGRHLLPDALTADDKTMTCQSTAVNSKLAMACGSVHLLSEATAATRHQANDVDAWIEYDFAAKQGHTITLEKLTVYTDSLDMDKDAMLPFVNEELTAFAADGYDKEFAAHAAMMEHFWETADIRVDGDVPLQQGLRFNLYHIMQASGRDGRTGMGAKGLSGEGYEGHYFWDTEMYVLPVFVYTQPELARSLLDYRYSTLDKARDRARVLGHPIGALYPWRTINGEEASTYFPLGTAQYHINADVAYAFQLYVAVTNDIDYLADKAAEVLCETARVWADVGCFAECRGGKYCICSVTGPDEYNAIVDNNFYTNLMAQQNLYAAVNALETLKEQRPDAYQKLIEKIQLDPDEPALWKKTADAMYFAYDEKRQVYLQDDGFMLRKPWDDSRIPPEKRHLLYENYHPLFIYRQRMSKQADAIMGMMLYSALFTDEELLRNYDFYQTVTLHHSSLSTCIFGILASRIGRHEDAYTYFAQSARMDLDDYHDNLYAGIHAANMAGTWQSIVFGFAGLRLVNGVPEFKFYIPEAWNGYHFTVKIKESVLAVDVLPDGWTITLQSGDAVNFLVEGKPYELTEKGASCHEAL